MVTTEKIKSHQKQQVNDMTTENYENYEDTTVEEDLDDLKAQVEASIERVEQSKDK